MELGDRWRGLRGGGFPFGDAPELFCLKKIRPVLGDWGDEGRAPAGPPEIERRFSDGPNGELLLLTLGACDMGSLSPLSGLGWDIIVT